MKLIIADNQINEQPEQFIRCAGYGSVRYKREHKESYARRFTANHYPRFHCYIIRKDNQIIFDLHLDQKEASYSGSHMHNAEYDGPLVGAEIERLKSLFTPTNQEAPARASSGYGNSTIDPLTRMKKGDYDKNPSVAPKKKNWLQGLFPR